MSPRPLHPSKTVLSNRRLFLRAAGVSIALPALEATCKSTRAFAESTQPTISSKSEPPIRMVCVGNEFGMYPGQFWPDEAGREYALTPLLEPLAAKRNRFTLFSHLDHGLKGGHFAVHTFLTGVKSSEAKGMPDGGISLDQRAAEHVGARTRFPSLVIGSESGLHGGPMMSWTRTGTRVPPIKGPRELFHALFVDEDATSKGKTAERISLQNSILDSVLSDARALKRRVSKHDHEKLEEYFSAIRDVELRLELERHWQDIPKPKPGIDEPENRGLTRDLPKLYDLIALAIQTDSTRVATLEIGGSFAASDLGIKRGYHSLSHHGKVQESIDLLVQIEKYQVEHYARFLEKLDSIQQPESDDTLLDSTMVLFGSGMGNANSHTNHDLPVILAGGGFRHGQHLRYPEHSHARVPLCNLYLSMLQRFGIESDRFSKATGTISQLELG